MLTTKQAANRLGISERRVQSLVNNKQLKAQKVSGIWLIEEESVNDRLANANKAGGRPALGSGSAETAFILMNRTHKVVDVIYDSHRKSFSRINTDINPQYAPLGLSSKGVIPLQAFNHWWRARGIPQTRQGLQKLLEREGANLPEELIQRNLGLSLSDQYWIKPKNSSLNWEEVNFFNNPFEKVSLSTKKFAPEAREAQAKPDNTSDGNLEKHWECRNETRMLLKGGTQYGQEPYNEVIASALHRRLLSPDEYVPYELEGEGATALSCCANFLNDEEEYIPAIYVMRSLEQQPSESDFEHYLACCERLGAKGVRKSLERMIVCDDVIANSDRHYRNFGLIRNVETGACRPAPLFDSGSSLWFNVPTSRLAAGEHGYVSKQFYESPAKQMLLVEDLSWFDEGALSDFVDEAIDILSKNDAISARLPYIRSALEWRVERMRNIAKWN